MASDSYVAAVKHPWSCLVFVAPLLFAYEIGLLFLGPSPDEFRNGADYWIRANLVRIGLPGVAAPLLVVGMLIAWNFLSLEARPREPMAVWIGMLTESAGFATVLFGISQAVYPLLQGLPKLEAAGAMPWHSLLRFFGAGIYEETLFRLVLFGVILGLFREAEFGEIWSFGIAAVASALLFAGAHNLGSTGDTFRSDVFLFRSAAGLFFAALHYWRGFGIVVGAHAVYDVLASL
ncbi:MAG: CPBP family intramembrane glutamic endopeptidase [Gemmataceae bacterium]